jgi:FkbM family methyltransferase
VASDESIDRELVIFGDSHALYCFDRIEGAKVNWLGPVTMHRVARDGAWFLREWQPSALSADIVLEFGEIDVRCHLGRIADSTGQSREVMCHDVAWRYLDAIKAALPPIGNGRVVVSSVTPPANGPGILNADFPVYGSWDDRAKLTRNLNRELREGAEERGFLYLDFAAPCSTPQGYIREDLSDGSVHIARAHAGIIVERLSDLLGRKLTMRRIDPKKEVNFSKGRDIPRGFGKTLSYLLLPRTLLRARSASEGLGRYKLHSSSRVLARHPLTISNDGLAWSYIVSWDNIFTVAEAIDRGLQLEIDIEVVAGDVEIGILVGDNSTFVDRIALRSGRQKVTLQAPSAHFAGSIVVRNREGSVPPTLSVHGVEAQLTAHTASKERGFLAKDVFDDLASMIGKGESVIVDIGANRGDTVARFLDAIPAASIFAVEPHPETFAQLHGRFGHLAQVRARNLGISNRSGYATLYSYSNAAINSLSPVATGARTLMEGAIEPTGEISVPVQSLADFLAQEGLNKVDVLKLDTQGHEVEILGSAMNELRDGHVRFVLAELIFAPLYERQSRTGDVIALLESCGFKLFDFYDFVYDDARGVKWGDALFEFVGRA